MQYCNDIYQQLFGCSNNRQKSPPFMFLGTGNLLILQEEQKICTECQETCTLNDVFDLKGQ